MNSEATRVLVSPERSKGASPLTPSSPAKRCVGLMQDIDSVPLGAPRFWLSDSLTATGLEYIRDALGVPGVLLLRLTEGRGDAEIVVTGHTGPFEARIGRLVYAWYHRTCVPPAAVVLANARSVPELGASGLGSLVVLPVHTANGATLAGFLVAADTESREVATDAFVQAQAIARFLLMQLEYQHFGHAEGVSLAARTAQHELNNAMSKVQLRAELVSYDFAVPPILRERAEQIRRSVQRLVQQVRTSVSGGSAT